MHMNFLEKLYDFLMEKTDMPDFMSHGEKLHLVPLSNIEYRNKIRGTMISLAIGDAIGSHLEGQYSKEIEQISHFLKGEKTAISLNTTNITESTILFSESLIINQGFHPEDFANRLIRSPIIPIGKTMSAFVSNYRDRRMFWYESGVASAGNGAAIRCAPVALIHYGDFEGLKFVAGIQAFITHNDQMALASSILMNTALAHLLNTEPYTLDRKEEKLKFLEVCAKGIKGIETQLYPSNHSDEVANLYIRLARDLPEALEVDMGIEAFKNRWGTGAYALESIPLALYLFLKSPDDYEKILKDSLMCNRPDALSSLTLMLAGAYLGFSNIPKGYLQKLRNFEEMLTLADRLFELSLKNKSNNPYRRMLENMSEEKSKDELDQLLWLAIKCSQEKNYEEAVSHFEELTKKNPDVKKQEKIKMNIIEAYEGLGTKYLENDAFEEALKCFKKALFYDLNNPSILCNLALSYLNLDDLNRAEKYARRAVEVAPEYEIGKQVWEGIKSLSKNN
ncbi:ADP-ribosylation/Crystallin J1 [Alkaliphilus metalliredigens QYMF]|uniref:ADP-ribosylation/Crystallin J1 n=1 Tax=Alkaliphilus metalliredigens (strain QYMF) TaxID=293826 RepID=A6TM84_ALKMQ|nr:ADP-ribosylglycohydrolase family protein [Alkaliphilus metalliredigens]ABR47302.1 ADP-ribosylation/Crystallin J1 [Alkaliphilus metalliredigens QYMF]